MPINLDIPTNLIFESATSLCSQMKNSTATLSPEMMMMQIQMMMAESCDEQIKEIANKLNFLKDVSQAYRNNINTVTTFLASPTKESHHGKKPVIVTTAAQASDLLSSLTTFSYNANTQTMESKGINLIDLESKHTINTEANSNNLNQVQNTAANLKPNINNLRGGIGGTEYINAKKGIFKADLTDEASNTKNPISNDTPANGLTNTLELSSYCDGLAKIADRGEYITEAKKLGDNKDLRLPLYYSNKSNDGLDGKPVMTFYVESVDKLLQVVQSKMDGLELEIDKLTAQLTDLTEKRRTALESANSILRKISDVNTNTLSKM